MECLWCNGHSQVGAAGQVIGQTKEARVASSTDSPDTGSEGGPPADAAVKGSEGALEARVGTLMSQASSSGVNGSVVLIVEAVAVMRDSNFDEMERRKSRCGSQLQSSVCSSMPTRMLTR